MVIDVTVPFNTASTSVSCGRTVYFPRPMNSRRTFSVRSVSTLNTVVLLTKIGMPIVFTYGGRNDPRPASA